MGDFTRLVEIVRLKKWTKLENGRKAWHSYILSWIAWISKPLAKKKKERETGAT